MTSSTHRYPELRLTREDMKTESELFRPAVFWDEASVRFDVSGSHSELLLLKLKE